MLTVNELFSGIGTQAFALEYLGIPFKIVGTSEIEKNAILAYNIAHGDTYNYGDISKIDKLDYADLWTYSFPCFTGDMPVLTEDGYVRIDEIKVGTMVYTHTGELHRVTNVFNNGEHFITAVNVDKVGMIRTTSNHKFYVYNGNSFVWKEVKDIDEEKDMLCLLKRDVESLTNENDHPLYVFRRIITKFNTCRKEIVYDIEVENDHSFTVKGIVVHNCQDLSSAGKGAGMTAVNEKGESVATRSGLLWQVERLLCRSCGYDVENGLLKKNDSYEVNPPKYLLLENVPELLLRKKHRLNFDKWIDRLEELGYHSAFGILNGGDFGVPQNRERTYCLSVRKDVYSGDIFFPNEVFSKPIHVGFENFVDEDVRNYKGPLMIDPKISNYLLPAYQRDIQDIADCSNDIFRKKDIWTCKCNSGFQDHRIGIRWAPTIRHQNTHTAIFFNNQIHKLTACECWKFMGIKEEDFWKVKNNSNISDGILCGLAGNAIVVPVLMSLFNIIWKIENGQEIDEYVPFLSFNDKI